LSPGAGLVAGRGLDATRAGLARVLDVADGLGRRLLAGGQHGLEPAAVLGVVALEPHAEVADVGRHVDATSPQARGEGRLPLVVGRGLLDHGTLGWGRRARAVRTDRREGDGRSRRGRGEEGDEESGHGAQCTNRG
jgi:hypothetical protein